MASTASDLDPRYKNLEDPALDKIPYRQLQQIAMSMQIPGNLKRGLMVTLIKARRDGKETLIQQELSQLQEKRQKRKRQKQSESNNSEKQTRRNVESPPAYPRHFQNYGPMPPVNYAPPIPTTTTYSQPDTRSWQPLNLTTNWPSSNNNTQEQEHYTTQRNTENTSTRGLPITERPCKPPYHGGKPSSWMSFVAQQNHGHYPPNPYFMPQVSNPPGQHLEDSNINPRFLSDISRVFPQYPNPPNHMYAPNFHAEGSKTPSCVFTPYRHCDATNAPNLVYTPQRQGETTNTPSIVFTPQRQCETTNTPSVVFTPQRQVETTNTPSVVFTPQRQGETTNTPSVVFTPQRQGESTYTPSHDYTQQRHTEATNTLRRVYAPQLHGDANYQHTLQQDSNIRYANPYYSTSNTNPEQFVVTGQHRPNITEINNSLTKNNGMPFLPNNFTQTRPSDVSSLIWAQQRREALRWNENLLHQEPNNHSNIRPDQISSRMTGTSESSITSNYFPRNNYGLMPSTSLQQQNESLGLITNPLQRNTTGATEVNNSLTNKYPQPQQITTPCPKGLIDYEDLTSNSSEQETSINKNPSDSTLNNCATTSDLPKQISDLGKCIPEETNSSTRNNNNQFQPKHILCYTPKSQQNKMVLQQDTYNTSKAVLPSTTNSQNQIETKQKFEDEADFNVIYENVLSNNSVPNILQSHVDEPTPLINLLPNEISEFINENEQHSPKVRIVDITSPTHEFPDIHTSQNVISKSSFNVNQPIITTTHSNLQQNIKSTSNLQTQPISHSRKLMNTPKPHTVPTSGLTRDAQQLTSTSQDNKQFNQAIKEKNPVTSRNISFQYLTKQKDTKQKNCNEHEDVYGILSEVNKSFRNNTDFDCERDEMTGEILKLSTSRPSSMVYQKTGNFTSESALHNSLHQQRNYQQPPTSTSSTKNYIQNNQQNKTNTTTTTDQNSFALHWKEKAPNKGLFTTTEQKNTTEENKTNYSTYDNFETDPHPPLGNRVPSISDEDDLMIIESETEDLFG